MISIKLHEKIRALRKSKGISQTFVAEQLEITVQAYSLKETGKRPIKTEELEVISSALSVSPSYFFEEKINVKLNDFETA
ncbi:helix-turn-helix domain-containing protein [Metabacillus litoralis]|uniref:helix-turn-helix domain-containing protein n=1 Tax=Metabacillus litoralis TaxID=152268 RepID=UPI00203FBF65|nr:helix-turn-helix domain-containing protein [Metabacillus litoralis]